MSTQLSKLHVRFIQTQKKFHLSKGNDTKGENLSLSQLYIKDNSNFYLINQNSPVVQDQELTLTFNEPTPALNTLTCKVDVYEMLNDSEEYEDGLLFFNAQAQDIKQLLLITIKEIE